MGWFESSFTTRMLFCRRRRKTGVKGSLESRYVPLQPPHLAHPIHQLRALEPEISCVPRQKCPPAVKRDCKSSHSLPWPHVHPPTHFVLAEYGGVVHDPLRVCSVPGHHHDPKLPNDHLHLGATQRVESFIATPCKTCHCLPTPPFEPCESWTMVWREMVSDFEAMSTAFGRNMDLCRKELCGQQ